ncbi:DNA cytosine methyltransferase [Parasediminibacterium sp. JCM 36343]|uniref:DNA cytosine methyltransferase n=1 Tax=Parasediminibacterium sp. JCM 36343 TaxID=3374279 RepID=UPI00397C3E35
MAGLKCSALSEMDKWACRTLRKNRPHWDVLEGDIRDIDFKQYRNKIDVVTGGFPCQSFSKAGKRLGLADPRGMLFYEFARAVDEVQPIIFVGENVRGLASHDEGKTLRHMLSVLEGIGYEVSVQLLNSLDYNVPQKRERLIIVGTRKDAALKYEYPKPCGQAYCLNDALRKGELFDADVPISTGTNYSQRKKEILDFMPPKGRWKDLPLHAQKSLMGKDLYIGGGKTGMARRIGWDEPCPTLLCSPIQNRMERCHPDETRPFTVREYARIQTFPDAWEFEGGMVQQYKQIGNAVPVNFAKEIGYSLVRLLKGIST